MNPHTIEAYAKINLGLDVIGKLPNGYHQVKMIMQSVELRDELTLKIIEGSNVLTTDSAELPPTEDNLILRAANLMEETYSLNGWGVRIRLRKNIPIAAGMAGGSADAAAVMRAMNVLFGLHVPDEELMALAVSIGADVPYCILGGTALAEGIGEKLTALPPLPACHILIAKPDVSVSTKYVYEHLDSAGIRHHPDIDGSVAAIREGSLAGVLSRMENVLESVTIPAHPVIASIKAKMLELGAAASLMSGSGPTVFGIFTEQAAAEYALRQLEAAGLAKQVFLTAPCNPLKSRSTAAQSITPL
ncbi:MAG: 4-(cytidine 5'-diphospho)-2-C-methyl-D-erythritol kinase [Butyrivibrio sp.]|nr:4-(cytidine 5'-diphospho)-2-C-methyl-D-erythritol kinase [Acetatifactor muris]MCM1560680.1 4-(cytidine 5'-diphospho)-2-C-methyl-D-erythritol kinase [Butyrivibrio sp.]